MSALRSDRGKSRLDSVIVRSRVLALAATKRMLLVQAKIQAVAGSIGTPVMVWHRCTAAPLRRYLRCRSSGGRLGSCCQRELSGLFVLEHLEVAEHDDFDRDAWILLACA